MFGLLVGSCYAQRQDKDNMILCMWKEVVDNDLKVCSSVGHAL